MTSPRILIVCEEAWPSVSDSALDVLHWASSLRQNGCDVSLLTCRWNIRWPVRSECREVTLHRLLPAMTNPRRRNQFVVNADKWLRLHAAEYDLCIVNGELDFLSRCSERWHSPTPWIGRLTGIPSLRGTSVRSISNSRLGVYSWIVCPDAATQRFLVASGYTGSVPCIPRTCWRTSPPSTVRKRAARKSLSQLANEFQLPPNTRVVVSLGDLSEASGCSDVIDAAISLLNQGKSIRFWLSGYDRSADAFASLLRDHSWHHEVVLAGPFDEIDEWIDAADLIVLPTAVSRDKFIGPRILGSGQPFIVSKEYDEAQLNPPPTPQLVYSARHAGLVSKLQQWHDDPAPIERDAEAYAKSYLAEHHPNAVVEAWLKLLAIHPVRRTG